MQISDELKNLFVFPKLSITVAREASYMKDGRLRKEDHA
jgi:hypothetical protein